MIKKMLKAILGVALASSVGGGFLSSCALEPSATSPSTKAASLIAGMPPELTVYEPSITYDGTTTTLTYTVSMDFSSWSDDSSGVTYTPQKDVAEEGGTPDPQSIEALLLHYGKSDSPALFDSEISSLEKGTGHALAVSGSEDGPVYPHYVIIPLDTALIRTSLKKKYPQEGEDTPFPPVVWIEENPAIGKVEQVPEEDSWKDDTLVDTGLRISGLAKPDSSVVIAGTIDNFDDGEKVDPEKNATRLASIATVLADGRDSRDNTRYSSTISFYVGALATAILAGVSGEEAALEGATTVKAWMKTNKPALRVVYQWVD